MTVDEQTRAFLARMRESATQAPKDPPLEDFRAAVDSLKALGFDPEDVAEVRDVVIPNAGRDTPARLFRPEGGMPPLVIWAHGGSWVRVTVDLQDPLYRLLANHSGCAILAVDYELSPESQFPQAIEEVYSVAVWAAEHAGELDCDPGRLAIGGESSGGNLAAAVAAVARDRQGVAFEHQFLLQPVLDAHFESDSWQELGQDYALTPAQLEWAIEKYAPGVDRADPLLSPLRALDHAGLPPTTVVVGEYDPLRDEGIAYAEQLRRAGVPADVLDIPGLIHHALMVPKAIELGQQAATDIAAALGRALHAEPR